MKINRKELLNVLQKMQRQEKMNFKDDIIYQVENDIMIYNKFFETNLKENFSLPFSTFTAILSKLKDDEIELIIEDTIKIKTKKTEIEFSKENIKQEFDFITPFDWIDLPEKFLKGIQFANKIINDNQKIAPIIYIDINKIVSTDGKTLIIYNLGIDFNKFFLTKIQIDLLLKLKVKKYLIVDNLIYFLAENNSIVYFNYETDLKFLPYEKIKMEDEKEIQFLDKINLSDIAINKSISDSDNYCINIEIDNNQILLKSNNIGINIKTKLEKENYADNSINFKLEIEHLFNFLESEYSNKFKTYIDKSKICFVNDDIKFITILRN